jgi:molybdopterin molybdotransferase
MLDYDEALARLLAGAEPLREAETVLTQAAAGRVLATSLHSGIDVPPLDNTSMDGYAVRCADVSAAGTRLAVAQRIPAGSVGHTLARGTAARIFTGAPMPHGADAVVMQELCTAGRRCRDHQSCAASRRVDPPPGEDIAPAPPCWPPARASRPQMLGLAASVGCATLPVFRRLGGAVLHRRRAGDARRATAAGRHLQLQPLRAARPARSPRLRGVPTWASCPIRWRRPAPPCAPRRPSNDLIVTSGGVSMGEEDHVKPAVRPKARSTCGWSP